MCVSVYFRGRQRSHVWRMKGAKMGNADIFSFAGHLLGSLLLEGQFML